jgi:hypothetical protein
MSVADTALIAAGGYGIAAKVTSAAGRSSTVVTSGTAITQTTIDVAANRVTLRVGTKAEIQAAAPKTAGGDFIDPNTGQIIPRTGPFHYGHKPGYEWSRTQQRARDEGWTREEVLEYENEWTHYQIEDPRANMSHRYEMPR